MSCSPCYCTANLIDMFCLSNINDDDDDDDDDVYQKWLNRIFWIISNGMQKWVDIVIYWWLRQRRRWILHRWGVRAALPWQWRHHDAECSLWSDEDRSMCQERAGVRADVAGSTLLRMFSRCLRHRQQTLLWSDRMFTPRSWPKLRQHKAVLRQPENAPRGGVYVH